MAKLRRYHGIETRCDERDCNHADCAMARVAEKRFSRAVLCGESISMAKNRIVDYLEELKTTWSKNDYMMDKINELQHEFRVGNWV